MDTNFGDVQPAGFSRGFLTEQMIPEPIAKQSDRIADRLSLPRDTETLRPDGLVLRKKSEIPTKLNERCDAKGGEILAICPPAVKPARRARRSATATLCE